MCKEYALLIQCELIWVPSNGKIISRWIEKIIGNPSLETIEELSNLKLWFLSMGYPILQIYRH
jgi:hypothetical protein